MTMVDQNECSASSSFVKNVEIGSRVECSSYYGTVKYIGEVVGYKSLWLGIDWDDPTRGKHDGSANGKQYFIARTPISGSLVRPGKVKTGIDAIRAITSRYGKKEDHNEALINKQELLSVQREINAPFLTMVGFEKINELQSNFQDLKVVSLRMQLVNGPGPEGQFTRVFPNIQELDISKNLISKWTDIFNICGQLKTLHWLNVSENILTMPEDIEGISFPSLKSLICNYMKLDWNDILRLSCIFPEIEEFRMQYNEIINLDIPNNHYLKSLRLLDLEGNPIKNWSEINKLGGLSTLKHLMVINTSIQNINIQPASQNENMPIFNCLEKLVISENLIDNWESISELNKLKSLEDLRFLRNPILESETPATCFQLTVARISSLMILNGTTIRPDDRKGAEYDYIKKQGLEWIQAKKDEKTKAQFLEKHPRYLEIITRYGEAEESELSSKAPSLKTSLTTVEIQCGDKIKTKKLPSTMSLQKLIMLVQKLFNLPDRPVLCYISNDRPDMEIEMDDEFKEIGYYSLQDGDRIIVK